MARPVALVGRDEYFILQRLIVRPGHDFIEPHRVCAEYIPPVEIGKRYSRCVGDLFDRHYGFFLVQCRCLCYTYLVQYHSFLRRWKNDCEHSNLYIRGDNILQENIKKNTIIIIIAIVCQSIILFGISLFNQNLLMAFSLPVRMIFMFICQWAFLPVPNH